MYRYAVNTLSASTPRPKATREGQHRPSIAVRMVDPSQNGHHSDAPLPRLGCQQPFQRAAGSHVHEDGCVSAAWYRRNRCGTALNLNHNHTSDRCDRCHVCTNFGLISRAVLWYCSGLRLTAQKSYQAAINGFFSHTTTSLLTSASSNACNIKYTQLRGQRHRQGPEELIS